MYLTIEWLDGRTDLRIDDLILTVNILPQEIYILSLAVGAKTSATFARIKSDVQG